MAAENRFDKVILQIPDGGSQTYSPEEFLTLPIVQRVDWLCQGRFKFYKSGQPISALEALKPTAPRKQPV